MFLRHNKKMSPNQDLHLHEHTVESKDKTKYTEKAKLCKIS